MNCPTCSGDFVELEVMADTLTEVVVRTVCVNGHDETFPFVVPVKARPVTPEHPVVVPGATFMRRRAPLVARR